MKTFFQHALLLVGIIIACQTGSISAGESDTETSEDSVAANTVDDQEIGTPLQEPSLYEETSCAVECLPQTRCKCCVCKPRCACRIWYVDFRVQSMFSSHTSYQFGSSPDEPVTPYAPMSKLDFPLNSTWTGFRVGVRKPNCDIHFEWLTPMESHISGIGEDYDWNINQPRNDPNRLDSLSYGLERWNDGQKLELEADLKWWDCFLGTQWEFWPVFGFRWQRFNMTDYAAAQIVPPNGPFADQGDQITFNQQYYIGYIGAQLRRSLSRPRRPPIALILQADWGGTAGYNVDHHLDYEKQGIHRYTMESTGGGALHFSIIVDDPLTRHLSIGLQAEHTEIRTTGTHHFVESGASTHDETWDNGVSVKSDQTSITAYLRGRW